MHGLIATVESRILPKIGDVIMFLVSAVKMESTDMMGCRMACGLISDIANQIEGEIVQYLQAVMPALFENLQGAQFETDAKLAAIIAIGDICLASGGAFTEYA